MVTLSRQCCRVPSSGKECLRDRELERTTVRERAEEKKRVSDGFKSEREKRGKRNRVRKKKV